MAKAVKATRTLWPQSDLEIAQARYDAGVRYDGPWSKTIRDKGKFEQRIRSLVMGIGYAVKRDPAADPWSIDPWAALLLEVERCNDRIAKLEEFIEATAQTPADLLPGGAAFQFVNLERQERRALNEATKVCIAAGIAVQQNHRVNADVEAMIKAVRVMFEALGMSENQRDEGMEILSTTLIELEAGQPLTHERKSATWTRVLDV